MKIIDLLNKIANKNIPNRIIYNEYVYQWNKEIRNYEREIDIDTTLNWDYIAIECLNDEVEIIDENKKIEQIDAETFLKSPINIEVNELYLKTRELIDEVNKLKEGK